MAFKKLLKDETKIGQTWRDSVQVTEADGTAFPAAVYRGLNLVENPRLSNLFFGERLNVVESPDEQREYPISVPVYLHDAEKGFFALFVPPELRHREREFRRQLLQAFQASERNIPRYFREFPSVFGRQRLRRMLEGKKVGSSVEGTLDKLRVTAESILEDWRDFQEKCKDIGVKGYPLDEVIQRVENEKQRLNHVIDTLESDVKSEVIQDARTEIKQSRQALKAERLRYEQHERWERDYGGGPVGKTEVVQSEDILEHTSVTKNITLDESKETTSAGASRLEDIPSMEPRELIADVSIKREHREQLQGFVSESAGLDTKDGRLAKIGGELWAIRQLDDRRLRELTVESVSLFAQYVVRRDYPFIGLILAEETDKGFRDTIGWGLDILGDNKDREILDRLVKNTEVRFALFDSAGSVNKIVRVKVLLEQNFEWIRARAKEHGARQGASFKKAFQQWTSEGVERLGSKEHELHAPRFNQPQTPSEVLLAASVVGHWSKPENFEYLIGRRSFPLEQFREMQQEVVEKALQFGIHLPPPVVNDARESLDEIELNASHPGRLSKKLLNHFAKTVSKGQVNDLTPHQEWENWFSLIETASKADIKPSSQYMELAESAYKRAQQGE